MTFTLFNQLPPELRLEIWHWALPQDDTPEVCQLKLSVQNSGAAPNSQEAQPEERKVVPEPLIVDLPFPAAMHVCFESRAVVLSQSSHVLFRYSEKAQVSVPYRAFRPELDQLYIGTSAFWNLRSVWRIDENLLGSVEHVALDHHIVWALNFFFHLAPNVKSITTVVGSTKRRFCLCVAPTRRCRLQEVTDTDLRFFQYEGRDGRAGYRLLTQEVECDISNMVELTEATANGHLPQQRPDLETTVIKHYGRIFAEYENGDWTPMFLGDDILSFN